MRFTPQFLEELKSRLPVSEVVGRRVKLIRSGREYKGLSPFNKEKTPSFFVNDQKEAWFDFSSGKNGSIFDFVMMTEGVTFPEAVEQLAQMAGMPLPKVSEDDQRRDAKRKTLHDVMEIAAKFFETTLSSRAGAKARGYLADRGLDAATQVKFRIGYAPGDRYALKEHLGSHGISTADMVEAGLLIAGDDIPVPFDRFRDRVMFPITDVRGRIIAFGGRALEKDVAAKYLNSPETPLFHKGHTLYNIAAARQAAHDGAPVVVVEGYVDVIAMVTAGYPGAVAPLGTALTEEQLGLIWKMTNEPVLCFDGDGAGLRAARRAVDLAMPHLKPGKSLKVALLPQGQDPDDLLRSAGPDAIRDVINAAQPMAQMLWQFMTEGHDFGTPERRAALDTRITEVTTAIADESVRKYYRQEFNERLRSFFQPAQNQGFAGRGQFGGQRGQFGGNGVRQSNGNWQPRFSGQRGGPMRGAAGPYVVASQQMAASPVHRGHRTAVPTREALILQAALNYPWLLHDHLEELSQIEFRHPDAERVKGALIDIAAQAEDLTSGHESETLRAKLAARGLSDALERVFASVTTASVWGVRPDAAPDDVLVTWQQLVALHRQWHSLTRELREAELALGQDMNEANNLRLVDIKERLARMDGTEALIEGFGASSGRGARTL
ncbi:DNA primase [Undibacter mobilis]|uniref:DNA primase n=1 Tax=Undibacter mobilis TaxID=2292256 RepID=A0A371BAS1_9BRAD|nr:DNA primase [Undibacter mobilis]RDV04642.1 DNA primase [Undibacter mobilis]